MRAMKLMLAGAIGMGVACSVAAVRADHTPEHKAAAGDVKKAMAHVMGAGDMKDKIKGHLTLTQVDGGVKVTGEITGLTPGKHGFHVHEKGDLSDPKLTSAGGHFNPGKEKHGGPDSHARHAGDWGNILADEKGVAKVDGTFKDVTLSGKDNGILGRSLIVHAGEDDMKTDPSGKSGDRIAGAKIVEGEMKTEEKK